VSPIENERVAVIGGGVVGCAVVHALARRGVSALLLEAEPGLALGASGANSGILHTGFDSHPGELETGLILRAAVLRAELHDELGLRTWRCGALLSPAGPREGEAVALLAENARVNGVEAHLDRSGALNVPGEAVTDPVAFVHALAGAAAMGGAEVRVGAPVESLTADCDGELVVGLSGGERLRVGAVVNCAGLHADEVARLAGDEIPSVYPRKGEFLVFAKVNDDPLEQILLPVPSPLGKGVLVFPTVDGTVVAGPTARERSDKLDFSVERDATELILPRAVRMYPPLERAAPLGSYAGLRPAGREANYVIEHSNGLRGLIHVAAIRSTGLSASLAIGEYVVNMLAERNSIAPGAIRPLPRAPAVPRPEGEGGWWERAARHHGGAGPQPLQMSGR
jgi:glycerol-3-phosphate dehydrogenase